MATSLEEASEQLDNTGQIEIECQLVQEQLITLTTARNELLREFKQLIGGSARLLLQIQEDSTPASERKLHKYEAQKRLLEEKLSSLETELRTKAEKLADLDSKAGDYLLKVSSSGCFTEEDDEELSSEGQEMLREAVLAEMLNAELNAESNLEGAVAVIDSSSDAELCAYNVKENGKLIDLEELNNISEDTVDAFFSDSISVKPTNNSVENETNEIPKSSACIENNITPGKQRQPSSELPSSEVEEAVPSGATGKTVESLTGTEIGTVTQEIDASAPIVNNSSNTVVETLVDTEISVPSQEIEDVPIMNDPSNTVVESLTGTEIAVPSQKIEASAPIVNDSAITAVKSLPGTETTIAETTQENETTSPMVNGAENTVKDSNTTIGEAETAVAVVNDIVTSDKVLDRTSSSQSVQDVTVDKSSKDSILEESKDKIKNTLNSTNDQTNVNKTALTNVESAICEFEHVQDISEKDSDKLEVCLSKSEQNKEPEEVSQTLPEVIPSEVESTQNEISGDEKSLSISEGSGLVGVFSETLSEESLKISDLITAEVASSKVSVVSNGIEESISISLTQQDLSQNNEKIEEKSTDASGSLPSESDLPVGTPSTLSKQSSTATELAETLSEESSAGTESTTLSVESLATIDLPETLSEGTSATLSEETSAATDMTEIVASPVASVVLNEVEESVATSLVQCALSQCIGKTEGKLIDASSIHLSDSVSVVEVSSTPSVESSTATKVTSDVEVASSVVPVTSEQSITKSLSQSVLSQGIEPTEEKSHDISLVLASESASDSLEENGSKTLLKCVESESKASNIKMEENNPNEEVIATKSNVLQNDIENSALSMSEETRTSCSSEAAPKASKVKTSGSDSPVQDQMASLASLVSELRRVKEDMGKCMSVKEQSFVDLEDQLEATKAELALVKESMGKMTNVIKQKDETCQKMEEENESKKIDIELKMKDIQEVTNKCSMLQTEKEEVLCKMEVLEIMMTEYRTEIEMLVTEKTKIEEETKQLLAAKQAAATAQAEIDSQPTTELENEKPQENGDVIPNYEAVVTTLSVKEEEPTSQISTAEVSEETPKTAELAQEENSNSIIIEKETEPEKPTEEELQSLQEAVDEINAKAPVIYKDVNKKDFNVQYDINEEIEILRTKVESLEKEKKEAMDKLKVNNKHLKIMDKDRKHKQRECELLRTKVEKVELKMCELQGTFDVLVKAIMNERDELIREVEEKSSQLTQLDASLTQIKEQYEQEIEKVQTQKKGIENELEKYQTGQLVGNNSVVDSTELDAAKAENERLSALLGKKTEETQEMISKNQEVHKEMQDFVNFLKEERTRLQQETDRAEKEKDFIQDTFNTLQGEHTQLTSTNVTLEETVTSLEAAQKEKDNTLEGIKLQLEDLQKQLEDLNTKNFNLTSEMYQKDEEYKEELSAREGTIQELNTTLTNNQKQSRDNYNQLQEDMTELETRLTTSLRESQAFCRELEGKMKELEENKNREIQGLQSHVTTMRESKEKIVEEKAVIYEKLLQTQSTMLRRASANKEEASTQIEDGDSPCETSSAVSLESISEEATSPENKIENQSEDKVPYDGQERIRALTTELESMRSNWQHGQEEKQREAMENEEKCKSPNNTDFGSQEEFEQLIRAKEAKISDLEGKVNELESTLVSKNGYIAELEGKLETSSEIQEVRQTVEAQVEQINKLSEDITKLKEELEQTYKECAALKNTVDELENTKQSITTEKDNLVKEYEEKLQQASGNLDQANVDLELKKNLVERLESELSQIKGSFVGGNASVDRSLIDRLDKVEKIHSERLCEIEKSHSNQIIELRYTLENVRREKKSAEDKLLRYKRDHEEDLQKLKTEINEEKIEASLKLKQLEDKKVKLNEEKSSLEIALENHQSASAKLQTDMVTDLEKLILDLEASKKSLEKDLEKLQKKNTVQSDTIIENEKKMAHLEDKISNCEKEKEIASEEISKLKGIIGLEAMKIVYDDAEKVQTVEKLSEKVVDLTDKLDEAEAAIEKQEQIYSERLETERNEFKFQINCMKREKTTEADVIEQRKEEVVLEFEDKLATIATEYEDRLNHMRDQYESHLLCEKADFGRVLVDKNNEYERKLTSKDEDIVACQSQVEFLQNQLEHKLSIIDEMECKFEILNHNKGKLVDTNREDLKHSRSSSSISIESSNSSSLQSSEQQQIHNTSIYQTKQKQLASVCPVFRDDSSSISPSEFSFKDNELDHSRLSDSISSLEMTIENQLAKTIEDSLILQNSSQCMSLPEVQTTIYSEAKNTSLSDPQINSGANTESNNSLLTKNSTATSTDLTTRTSHSHGRKSRSRSVKRWIGKILSNNS